MEALIVGWGHTKFGKLADWSLEDLMQHAAREALASPGIAPADAVCSAISTRGWWPTVSARAVAAAEFI